MYYKMDHILKDLENTIDKKLPFSLVKMGDGEIKFFGMELKNEISLWKCSQQCVKPDLPFIKNINKMIRISANEANYLGGFGVYFKDHKYYWPRKEYSNCSKVIVDWKKYYDKMGIINTNYCSPEIGFYFFLNEFKNLFDVMRNKKVLIVTCWDKLKDKNPFKNLGYDVEFFIIPKRNTKGWKHFENNLDSLGKIAPCYDLILLSGGTLGRCYSGRIKRNNGRVIEIGQVSNVWAGYDIPPRNKKLIKYNKKDMSFNLTSIAKKYINSI